MRADFRTDQGRPNTPTSATSRHEKARGWGGRTEVGVGEEMAEQMGLMSNLLQVGNELESRRVQPARRGIFLR